MIRIHTLVGEGGRVCTLWFNGVWYTFATRDNKLIESHDAPNLMEAGQNHLHAACAIRKMLQPDKIV